MAISRVLEPGFSEFDEFSLDMELPVEEEVEESGVEVTDLEDGGVVVDFDPEGTAKLLSSFDANLVEILDERVARSVASELESAFQADRQSRRGWERTYIKGLRLVGMTIDDRTRPFAGACGVTHPVMAEAAVEFQSQAIGEIFPSSGPAKTKIIGRSTKEKTLQSSRIGQYMNYLLTEKMEEYRAETEKLLFSLPLAGSAFKKVYWDESKLRPAAMFVPAEDLVVSHGAASLDSAERVTHVMKVNKNDLRKMQVSGFYSDIELGDPVPHQTQTPIQTEYDKLKGESPNYQFVGRYTLLEVHTDLDLEGFEDMDEDGEETGVALPYVVTIELGSLKCLGIRRNWSEDDPTRQRRQHFVHYEYMPGLGFYAFGLINMIGGLAKSSTSILRQLVDAGTLANLPGGLKTKGLRFDGDDTPIAPGEWKDVDVPGGSIRDNILPLPYKEPSGVLFQLMQNMVDEARRFASLADLKASDLNAEAPVGTTLAIIERTMKIMTAIQARLHASMKKEFKILTRIVKENAPHEYPYDVEGKEMLPSDFDDRIDVEPVSDPNASTMAQRIMQHQAALQLASQAPGIYDVPMLHRSMLEALGFDEASKIVPLPEEIPVMDPISENMAILNGKPVKAKVWEDHESHIMAHMAAKEDPRIMALLAQSPQAQAIASSAASHITEHVAFLHRVLVEKELGVSLPSPEDALPEDVAYSMSKMVAEAASRVTGKAKEEAAAKKKAQEAEDPILQARLEEVKIQRLKAEGDLEIKRKKLDLDAKSELAKGALEVARIESNERSEQNRTGAKIASDLLQNAAVDKKLVAQESNAAGAAAVRIMETLMKHRLGQDADARKSLQ